MWIKVQDEDILIEAKLIYINKGKNENSQCNIIGKITGNTVDENFINLGSYKDYKQGKFVFNDILNSLSKNEAMYIMP